MRQRLALCLLLALAAPPAAAGPLHYPETRRVDHTDTYHGVSVADPYRWLEDDVRQTPAVREWVEAQNRVTFGYLEGIPERQTIKERLKAIWTYEQRGAPFIEGNRYFFFRNDGSQNLHVLYTQRSLVEEPRVLIDPNEWSKDGTVTLGTFDPSPDGRFAVYGVREAGSDWETYRILDLETRQTRSDELRWIKFCCVSWTADSKGFVYSRLPEPEKGTEFQGAVRNQALYYHRLGTPQTDDVLVYSIPDQPDWVTFSHSSDDDRYLVLGINRKGRVFRVLVKDLSDPSSPARVVIPDYDNKYFLYVGNDGPRFYFSTDFEAPRGRVLAIDIDNPARENWQEIIPQAAEALRGVDLVGNLFAARYLKDALPQIRLYTLAGKHVRDLQPPGTGNIGGLSGTRTSTEAFYTFTSFNQPASIYRYDLVTGQSTLHYRPQLGFNPDDYEVRPVFYNSKDGTRVPLFLGHRKGLQLNGENPTLLTGYGGFNIAVVPNFNPAHLAWMEQGGVVALAALRGGGEYGRDWHEAGTKLRKQNVFDDFIAAAEWLVANRYTRPGKLAIKGGSNGGLLVGAVLNQRPDLFGAAIPAVGVMDMLRYHHFTMGSLWVDDYGTVDDPEQFKALLAYSPYHNLKDGAKYPPILVTTSDTDDRVIPGHSFKYAARLQRAQAGDAPVLIRIETKAGHGGAAARTGQIEESADEFAFLVKNLGIPWKPTS